MSAFTTAHLAISHQIGLIDCVFSIVRLIRLLEMSILGFVRMYVLRTIGLITLPIYVWINAHLLLISMLTIQPNAVSITVQRLVI